MQWMLEALWEVEMIDDDGFLDLASAVIQQWKLDGKPRNDVEGVKLWATLIESHHKTMLSVRHGRLHRPDHNHDDE
jgi:hypothetical protein